MEVEVVAKVAFVCLLLLSHVRDGFRWVHTCNVTAYRNAVTLQVTRYGVRAELSSRASRRNSIVRALRCGVRSLLRQPERCLCS